MVDALSIPGGYYTADESGLVYVHGAPTQADFEAAWDYVCHVQSILPRILGNMMAHAERAEWGGADYITDLMERSGRTRGTLYQYHSTYSRLPVENQLPNVKYSYDREAARLPPSQQKPALERVLSGDFENSTQFADYVRAKNKEPAKPTYAPPQPITCTFCGGNGWNREKLHWLECPHCGAHADELADRFLDLLDAVRQWYQHNDRTDLDDFVQPFNWT